MPLQAPTAAFALLDDSADPAGGARLYTGLVREVTCDGPAAFADALAEIDQAARLGLHPVFLADYEFGVRLAGVHTENTRRAPGEFRALLFAQMQRLAASETGAWLAHRDAAGWADSASMTPGAPAGAPARGDGVAADHALAGPTSQPPGIAGVAALQADVTPAEFDAAIARIHAWLTEGECYQINYTYRLSFDVFGSPISLYRRLRARQPVPYGALIVLPDVHGGAEGRAILSLSPELFLRHSRGQVEARPMKGTAPASGDAAIDMQRSQALAADEKNRAENLMIVDLLRNDLGKLATPGSVRVPKLFEVTRFASVLQMTSTVTAELPVTTTFAQVMAALFPCGSITGAPKHRTMQLIGELEPSPRRLYTGSIGWYEAPQDPQALLGDFCLSVTIRTLEIDPPGAHGLRRGRLGVGAGIVLDSRADEEWAECKLKARFLTALDPGFALFETMAASRADGVRHLDRHLSRLGASAQYFGFAFDEAAVRTQVSDVLTTLLADADANPATTYRLRLALSHDGTATITHGVLTPLAGPVTVLLAPTAQATRADDVFLRHKSTVRAAYDAAWRDAESQGAFDMLFSNERGELTEGGRSNVFVKLDGEWLTPPLSAGVLPGVMRAAVLADPQWQAREAVVMRADLARAEAVMITNALRGAMRVTLVD